MVLMTGETQFESTPIEEENDYVLVRGLEPSAVYEFRVVAVDGKHQTPSKLQNVDTRDLGILRELCPD